MNRPNLYYHTVDLLIDAYNNEKLFHGKCVASERFAVDI